MQTIDTTYYPPTNYRASRITARSSSGHKVTVSWQDELDQDTNHRVAAWNLAHKLGWTGTWVGGSKRDKRGEVYVCISGDNITSMVTRGECFYVKSDKPYSM